jgi:V/A-type H+-transporting ATPase subunit A
VPFPRPAAISPSRSARTRGSRDADAVAEWHVLRREPGWGERRERALSLLAEADRLESIAQLVGTGSLPDGERVTLLAGRLLREGVLQQSALSDNDAYCEPAKQSALLDLVLRVVDRCRTLVDKGVAASAIEAVDFSPVTRARDATAPGDVDGVAAVYDAVAPKLGALE